MKVTVDKIISLHVIKKGQTPCLISLDWFQWAVFPNDNWSPPKMFIGLCMSLKDKYTPEAAWIGDNRRM